MTGKPPITMSSWTLGSHCTFEQRCEAASAAGYQGIGLRAENYVDALNEGLTDDDLLVLLQRYHLRCTEVEYIVQWCEEPRTYLQKYKEQICFHMCQLFQVNRINTGLLETYPIDYVAQKLRELCQRTGQLIIALEPMPYSGIPDLATAWQIIQQADCPNIGLLLDVWHWARAKHPVDSLTTAQAKRVVAIQLDDANQRAYAPTVLRAESMHDRLAPGDGAAVSSKFIRMLKLAGVQPQVIGVEVVSDRALAKGINWTANDTYRKTKQVLADTWPEMLSVV